MPRGQAARSVRGRRPRCQEPGGDGGGAVGPVVAAIDPGREKCGVAVVTLTCEVVSQAVVPTHELARWLGQVPQPVAAYVVGHRTGRSLVLDVLRDLEVPEDAVQVVDEDRSTELGRQRYWAAKRPRGWRRLLPTSLQVPPEPYDDFVAVVLAERYLSTRRPRTGEGSAGTMEK